jgi:leader peptidase (prepilin peptidase)/N-methyltransferase
MVRARHNSKRVIAPPFDPRSLLASPLFEVTAFLVGLVVGSFANVCIHRVPLGVSVVFPPSRCPSCLAPIAPWDNVPVLGWLWLRGRCRACRAPISIRYPAVELLNGLLYLGLARALGPVPEAVASMAFATALVILGLIDLDHQILPDAITLSGLLAGLAFAVASLPAPVHLRWLAGGGGFLFLLVAAMVVGFDRRRPGNGPDWRLLAALGAFAAWHQGVLGVASRPALVAGVSYLVMAVVAVAAERHYGQEALGQGDWKMVAMLGAFLGAEGTLLAVLLGTAAGAAVGLTLIALGRGSRRMKVPLGSFLALGGLVSLLAGEKVLAWYRGLLRG